MDGDLLDHIEKSNDSVDTTQLLDLLERETHQSGPLSSSVVRPPSNNNLAAIDGVIAVEKQPMSNGSAKKQTPKRRRTKRSGYNSGDSHDSSFTSTLLGGNALLNLLEDDLNTTKSSETAPAPNGASNYASSSTSHSNSNSNVDNSDRSGATGSGGDSQKNSTKPRSQQRTQTNNTPSSTPQKNGAINYNSDSNSTTTRGSTNKYARQAFDNPFGGRRRSTDLLLSSSGNERSNNNQLGNANNNTSAGKLSASITKGKGSSADLAKVVAAAEATTEAATVTSDDTSGIDSGGRTNTSSRHSVSFSIEESGSNNDNREDEDYIDADDEEEEGDDVPPHNSDNEDNQRHYASDTFSLTGSLASLAISARSGSNRSRSSFTTRSSRSSRSSHGSATTASTHSSKSSQERRQRREILPAATSDKKLNKKSNKGGSSRASSSRASGSRASSSRASSSRASSSRASSSRASSSHASSVASSSTGTTLSSLYRRNSKHKNKGKLFGDLHDEHPTRYPKRSNMIQEELNEDDVEDDGVGTAGLYDGSDLNSSNEDLFARTKSGSKSKEEDDFLGGLIASTTNKNGVPSLDNDDNASVGDTSFLSDLLNGHLNNGGDGRGGAKQRKGGSVMSGMSSIPPNSRNDDDAKAGILKSKSKKDYRRYDDDDDSITIVGKMEHFRDEGIAWVRRVFQRAGNWYEHGDPLPRTRQDCIQWCEDGGSLFPQSKKEWVQWGVLALVLTPLLHLAVQYIISGNSSINNYYGGEIQFIINNGVVGSAKANLAGKDGRGQPSLYSLGSSKAWAGSSMVMLSRRSSPRENFILIPDADWIELQISRNQASTNADGRTSFFRKKASAKDSPKPPQRLPLPSVLDPVHDSTAALVLFSLTASNGNNIPNKGSDVSKLNTNANFNLWNAIQHRLIPEPVDAWPSWSHNSLAQFREDSYTLVYPYSKRNEARSALVKLASEFGQSSFYEFITWSETPTGSDYGFSGGGYGEKGALERAGSIRRIGEDGSAIIIPPLPEGRSDIMIRSTIIVDENSADNGGEHPSVVMRRVKDLPVEDELTMREFEGPNVDEITWSKKAKLPAKLTNKKRRIK